jgi:putative transposase
MPNSYRSYHSGVKLQYANGELQSDISKDIPRSTKQRWKAKTIHSFWSHYPLEENDSLSVQAKLMRLKRENERLKVQVKTLFYLVSIYI